MAVGTFDKLLELAAVGSAVTATQTLHTGVAIPCRFLPTCDWVIHVTAIDAGDADETYAFSLQCSDVVGGTYTTVASYAWSRDKGVGQMHIPLNGDMFSGTDADSAYVRLQTDFSGTTPSCTYGSYLTKATSKHGLGVRAGETDVLFP